MNDLDGSETRLGGNSVLASIERDLRDFRPISIGASRSSVASAFHDAGQRRLVSAANQQLRQALAAVQDLIDDIEAFQNTIDETEEVQVVMIGGPANARIFLHSLTPVGADRIRFEGLSQDGDRVVVVQHVTQMNVMLQAIKVKDYLPRRMTFEVVEAAPPPEASVPIGE